MLWLAKIYESVEEEESKKEEDSGEVESAAN